MLNMLDLEVRPNKKNTLYFQKKPIVQLKAASALNRILVLCDNTLTMLNMLDLEVRPKKKSFQLHLKEIGREILPIPGPNNLEGMSFHSHDNKSGTKIPPNE